MKPVTTLTIGDLHYKDNNLKDHVILKEEIFATIPAYTDLIFLLGDELDVSNPGPVVRTACVDFIKDLSEKCDKLIILVGNHTRPNNKVSEGPDHSLYELSGHNIIMVEDPMIYDYGGIKLGLLPYMSPDLMLDVINNHEPSILDAKTTHCVYAHQEIRGCVLNNDRSSACQAYWLPDYPPMVSGHIHGRYVMGNVFYPGTPMNHKMGEPENKYIYTGTIYPERKELDNWENEEGRYYVPRLDLIEHEMLTVPKRLSRTLEVSEVKEFLKTIRDIDYINITLKINKYNDRTNKHIRKLMEYSNVKVKIVEDPQDGRDEEIEEESDKGKHISFKEYFKKNADEDVLSYITKL
jgi:hypothetical protein